MSGKAPREKGSRLERLVVAILSSAGLDTFRVPLSGAAAGFKSDVVVRLAGSELKLECKSRKAGFQLFYDAMEADNAGLVLKIDREEPLICMPLRAFASLLARAEGVKPPEPNPLLSQSWLTADSKQFIEQLPCVPFGTMEIVGDRDVSINVAKRGEGLGLSSSPSNVSRET